MRGALLVAGTTSDAGKSALVAGICRWLHRRGVAVAPFKAQNMSNNSVVTADGGEIGRAQAMQAHACGLAPSVAFNPVLLKPGSDRSAQVVVRGRVDGTVSARSYQERKAALLDVVTASLADLRARFDVVVCEGAGSPAEINLRANDIANMGLAQAADLPVVVVGDIDRGGVLAHLFGTVAVLDPADQRRIAGFVVNKFRGDPALLQPGLDQLRALTGRPTLGVVPWAERLWLDAEDSLSAVADGVLGRPAPPRGSQWLRVAVVRLPRISNATDAEALACEPGRRRALRDRALPARRRRPRRPARHARDRRRPRLAAAHRPRRRGARARRGRDVRCWASAAATRCSGGASPTRTRVEGGDAAGLGLLDLEIAFDAEKHLANPVGTAWGEPVRGYEIHYGRVVRSGDPTLIDGEGSDNGAVLGTHWHGLLENDGFRRALLRRVAAQAGRNGFAAAPDTVFAAERAAQLDLLGDLVAAHLDTAALDHVIDHGADAGPPGDHVGSGSVAVMSMSTFPFTAVVGHDDLRLALLLNAVHPGRRRRARAGGEGHGEVDGGARAGRPAARARRGGGLPVQLRPRRPGPGLPGRAARRRRRGPPRGRGWSSCRSGRPRTGSSARSTWSARWPRASAPTSPVCSPRPTAACSTSTRSTCCTTTSSTPSSTPPPWAARTSSATGCRCRTRPGSCWSGR